MYKEKYRPNPKMIDHYYEFHHYYSETPSPVQFHQHEFYEILFFMSGNVTYYIEDRQYKLTSGDILLISPDEKHHPEVMSGKPYERIVLWFSPKYFQYTRKIYEENLLRCFEEALKNNYHLIRPDTQTIARFKHICNRLFLAKYNAELGHNALTASYLMQFLVFVNRAYNDNTPHTKSGMTENEKINQIIDYINVNLTKDLSLDNLADKFYISKYHLTRTFKQYTGLSLYQYIIKQRLIAARNMIKEGNSIMDSCIWCGFNDYSNFLKAFKKEFGNPPSYYTKFY